MKKIKILLLCFMAICLTISLSSCVVIETARFTVTEEEWEALTKQNNYTVLSSFEYLGEVNTTYQKYTTDVIEIDGDIILFIDDKQYRLTDTEYGWYAQDVTFLDFWNTCLLEGKNFEDYTFDENKCAYVGNVDEETGTYEELYFVNGVLLRNLYFTPLEEACTYYIYERYYKNIGSTIIDVPEYSFIDKRTLITEEQWNKYADEYNYSCEYYFNGYMESHTQKSTEGAWLYNDTYYVEIEDKLFKLVKEETGYVAVEADEFPGLNGPLLQGYSFDDIEYDEATNQYVTKNPTEDGLKYYFYFFKGELASVDIVNTLNPEEENKYYYVYSVGQTELEVPEYTIKTNE